MRSRMRPREPVCEASVLMDVLHLREVPGKNGVLCGFKLENTYIPLLNDPQLPAPQRRTCVTVILTSSDPGLL